MKTTLGPDRLNVVIQLDSVLEVWRIVRSDLPDDPAFLNSLRSNYELAHPPRKIESSAAVIHMGISTYFAPQQAEGTAQRFHRLGGFLARLSLSEGHGFNYARTGPRGHLTVWGDPLKLARSVVDIIPVQR